MKRQYVDHETAVGRRFGWARKLGINENTIHDRIRRGWSVQRAIFEPVQQPGGGAA